MNRFERAVYDCMLPTATLLEETTKPLHRAILLNSWRHVHLEGAGEYDTPGLERAFSLRAARSGRGAAQNGPR